MTNRLSCIFRSSRRAGSWDSMFEPEQQDPFRRDSVFSRRTGYPGERSSRGFARLVSGQAGESLHPRFFMGLVLCEETATVRKRGERGKAYRGQMRKTGTRGQGSGPIASRSNGTAQYPTLADAASEAWQPPIPIDFGSQEIASVVFAPSQCPSFVLVSLLIIGVSSHLVLVPGP